MKNYYLLLASFMMGNILANGQNFEWGGAFGGIGEDVVRAMAVDDAGNSYITGYFTDISDMDPTEDTAELTSNGFFDIFIQKIDTEGNLVWVRSFGGDFFDYGTGVEVDAEGNVYITGVYQQTVDFDPSETTFELTSQGAEDIFALKLNSDGEFIWAVSMGSPDYEEPVSIGVSDAGDVYVGGYFSSTGDYDPGEGVFELTSNGGQDAFVVKLSENGIFQWALNVGSSDQELVLGMDVNSDGDVFIAGGFSGTVDFDPGEGTEERSPISGRDGFVLKLTDAGDYDYVSTFGGTGNITAWDIALDSEGNAFAAGGFNGSFSTGFDEPLSSVEFDDAFVIKINPTGEVDWTSAIQGIGFQNCYDVNTDPSGNVLLTGYFGDQADFDFSEEELILTKESTEPFDAFVSVLNSEGELLYAANFGGSNFTEHHGVDSDSEGNIYLSAAYQNTVDLDPSPEAEVTASVVAFRDSYIIKLTPVLLSAAYEELPTVELYPNPAVDRLNLTTGKPGSFRIVNALGQIIRDGSYNGRFIDLNGLKSGLYILEVSGYGPAKFLKK